MYFRRRPHPSLAGHINYYWCVNDAPKHQRVQIVPSGTLEIAINFRDDAIRICDPSDPTRLMHYSGAVVSGAQSRHFVIDVRAHAFVIGVHFRPGEAIPLLGAPPGLLTDEHVDLEAIWGAGAIELRERLCVAATHEERFRILDAEFMQRLRSLARPRAEVRFALRRLNAANARVDRVAQEVDLSHRRLIEIFTAEVGVTPKVFSRVGRFQRALNLARQGGAPDWTQLALRCGYFDQPHLIREFVSLSGLSPLDLLHRSAAAPGHHAALAGRRG